MQDSCKWISKVCSKNRFNDKLPAKRRDLICTPECRFFAEHNKVNPVAEPTIEPEIVVETNPVAEPPHRGRPYKK